MGRASSAAPAVRPDKVVPARHFKTIEAPKVPTDTDSTMAHIGRAAERKVRGQIPPS